ncbi:MAG: hypothetical protein WDZ35_06170 [Crocinitomicaceae bacterium]
MAIKIHILLVLGLLFSTPQLLGAEKFLRIKGAVLDAETQEPLSNYTIKKVEDGLDSTLLHIEKTKFKLWVSPNRKTKLYFLKDGYVVKHILIDAAFIPSRAYKKKQKLTVFMEMDKATERIKVIEKPVFKIIYDPLLNSMLLKDMSKKRDFHIAEDYEPPFPSPADTYSNVRPTDKRLSLTTSYPEKKAKGNSGMASVLQGILFADMNYSLFIERTNDANNFLTLLRTADNEAWGGVKAFDSPEYGKIVMRTLNREQSVDTLFALGAHLETSRLIFQSFTSDSKVLIHLKTLKRVLEQFDAGVTSPQVSDFMTDMRTLIPHIEQLEETYKEQLRNKMNFEMKKDEDFQLIHEKVNAIYAALISKS